MRKRLMIGMLALSCLSLTFAAEKKEKPATQEQTAKKPSKKHKKEKEQGQKTEAPAKKH